MGLRDRAPSVIPRRHPASAGTAFVITPISGRYSPVAVMALISFMSLAATTKKLGVKFYHYIHERIFGTNQLPPLAEIIHERAQDLNLGASLRAA
jgi:hypothetical protein